MIEVKNFLNCLMIDILGVSKRRIAVHVVTANTRNMWSIMIMYKESGLPVPKAVSFPYTFYYRTKNSTRS